MTHFTKHLSRAGLFCLLVLMTTPSFAEIRGKMTNPHTSKPDFCIGIETEDQTVQNKKCKPLRVTDDTLIDNGSYFSLDTGGEGWVIPPIIEWFDPTGGLPADPAIGDRYGADATANGWTIDYVYEWDGTVWVESEPEDGWMVWDLLDLIMWVFFSGGWMEEGETSFLRLDTTNNPLTGPLHSDMSVATDQWQINQSSATGTEWVSGDPTGLIWINDDRTGTTANEKEEAALVIDTEGVFGIYTDKLGYFEDVEVNDLLDAARAQIGSSNPIYFAGDGYQARMYASVGSKVIQIIDANNVTKNHDHAVQANPTLYIQSVTNPDIANDEWMSFAFPITHGLIETGSGALKLKAAAVDIGNGATTAGVLAIYEDTDDGTNKATFTVPALAGDTAYTFPAALPLTSGQPLVSTTGGVMSWVPGLEMSNASILANATASGVVTLGGTGGSNDEDETSDYESVANSILKSSTTGVTGVDHNYDLFVGARFGEGNRVLPAAGTDHKICAYSDDTTNNSDTLCFWQDQADGNIASGAGDIKLNPNSVGDVTLFEDTDVGDAVNGKALVLHRKTAGDGDMSSSIFFDQFENLVMRSTAGSSGDNIFIGELAGEDIESNGIKNTTMGNEAGINITSGDNNICLGWAAGKLIDTGSHNVLLGVTAGDAITGGNNNFLLGTYSGTNITGSDNVGIGYGTLNTGVGISKNIGIGTYALRYGTDSNNVAIGYQAGEDVTGSANIFLGYMAGEGQTTVSDTLWIDNTDTATPLIYGDFSADHIQINGSFDVGDGTNEVRMTGEGVQTFHGNARYWQGIWLDTSNFKEPTTNKATLVNRGIGTAYSFADDQDAEHIHVQVSIPGFWDVAEDLQVILLWDSPTISGNCDWEVRYQLFAEGGVMDSTTLDGTESDIVTSSGTSKGLVHSTINIPTVDFDTGDKAVRFAIYRDGNDVGDTLGDFAYLHGIRLRGVRYKTGGAM